MRRWVCLIALGLCAGAHAQGDAGVFEVAGLGPITPAFAMQDRNGDGTADAFAGAEDTRTTLLLSARDDPGRPSRALMALALDAARVAADDDLVDLSARNPSNGHYVPIWPGEHYRFLNGLVRVLQPRRIVEIGTAEGWSALALLRSAPNDTVLTTFDIVPIAEFAREGRSCLLPRDFEDGRLRQVLADVSDRRVAEAHAAVLREADLIFLDAGKDGRQESRFLMNLFHVGIKPGAVLVFDDVRLMNMVAIWRSVVLPKLDATSLGHWSGTGLVSWTGAPPFGRGLGVSAF
jgi:predicted O-methyltransferase YrrM